MSSSGRQEKQTIAPKRYYAGIAGPRGRIQPADTAGSSSVNVECIASARRTLSSRERTRLTSRQVQKMIKRRLILALFIVLAIAGIGRSGYADLLINGAGATFPYPIYSKWFDVYAKENPGIKFNYQSIGSGGGIRMLVESHRRSRRERRADDRSTACRRAGKNSAFPERDGRGRDRVQPSGLHRHAAPDGSGHRGHLFGQDNEVG